MSRPHMYSCLGEGLPAGHRPSPFGDVELHELSAPVFDVLVVRLSWPRDNDFSLKKSR